MDRISKERRSWNMSRIKGKNTKPELTVRKHLFSKGVRYRINVNLPGRPDIAIKKIRTAIFVNGCFWHGHEDCNYAVMPKTNTQFWETKILGNKNRDLKNEQALADQRWTVIKIWECELKADP